MYRDLLAAAVVLGFPAGVVSLLFIPRQLRDRRLRKFGRRANALCCGYRSKGSHVHHVSCLYDVGDGREIRAVVSAPSSVPSLGARFEVVFDPVRPHRVESYEFLSSISSRMGLIFQGVFCFLAVAAAVLTTLAY
jgi:hypothetical protein